MLSIKRKRYSRKQFCGDFPRVNLQIISHQNYRTTEKSSLKKITLFRLAFPNELNLSRFVEEQTREENASAKVWRGEFVSIKQCLH